MIKNKSPNGDDMDRLVRTFRRFFLGVSTIVSLLPVALLQALPTPETYFKAIASVMVTVGCFILISIMMAYRDVICRECFGRKGGVWRVLVTWLQVLGFPVSIGCFTIYYAAIHNWGHTDRTYPLLLFAFAFFVPVGSIGLLMLREYCRQVSGR